MDTETNNSNDVLTYITNV